MSSLDIKSIRQKEDQLITQVSQDEDMITQVPDHRQANPYQKPNVRGSSMGGIAPNNGMAKGSQAQIRSSTQKRANSQNPPPQGITKSMTASQLLQKKDPQANEGQQKALLEQALRGTQAQARQLNYLKENLARWGHILPPQRKEKQGKKCLILDLDETLVHSSFKPVPNADILVPVEIEGRVCTVQVLKRPGVEQFLLNVAKKWEVVIYTASLAKYADPLLDQLDPQGLCDARLFREACVQYNGSYVKDLRRMGRDLKSTIIVDNSPVSFCLQPENSILIKSWFDDPSDTDLIGLERVLDDLLAVDNVMIPLEKCANDEIAAKPNTNNMPYIEKIVREVRIQMNGPKSNSRSNQRDHDDNSSHVNLSNSRQDAESPHKVLNSSAYERLNNSQHSAKNDNEQNGRQSQQQVERGQKPSGSSSSLSRISQQKYSSTPNISSKGQQLPSQQSNSGEIHIARVKLEKSNQNVYQNKNPAIIKNENMRQNATSNSRDASRESNADNDKRQEKNQSSTMINQLHKNSLNDSQGQGSTSSSVKQKSNVLNSNWDNKPKRDSSLQSQNQPQQLHQNVHQRPSQQPVRSSSEKHMAQAPKPETVNVYEKYQKLVKSNYMGMNSSSGIGTHVLGPQSSQNNRVVSKEFQDNNIRNNKENVDQIPPKRGDSPTMNKPKVPQWGGIHSGGSNSTAMSQSDLQQKQDNTPKKITTTTSKVISKGSMSSSLTSLHQNRAVEEVRQSGQLLRSVKDKPRGNSQSGQRKQSPVGGQVSPQIRNLRSSYSASLTKKDSRK